MLGIVIVNYHGDALTARFVREELPHIRIPYVAVIVDNGATPEASGRLEAETGVKVIPCENQGFARGNNRGIEYLSKNYDIDYFLFTNNDIHFRSPDVVDALVAKLEADPSIGIIGPEIVGLDGCRQSPEPYISLWDKYVWVYLSTPFLSKEKKAERFHFNYSAQAEEGPHYKLMGSFMLCRRADIEAVGGFDPNTFLYAEETILSERMTRMGKSLYFYPAVTVEHQHGATISSHLSRETIARQRFQSDAYYYHAYKGESTLSIRVARFLHGLILKGHTLLDKYPMEIDIIPYAGLCNRMRVMSSSYACARELGCYSRVLWCYGNRDCKVHFHALFQPVDLPSFEVVETDSWYAETNSWRHFYLPSLLRRLRYRKVYDNYNFRNQEGHRPLVEKMREDRPSGRVAICSMHQCGPNFPLAQMFRPVPEIEAQVQALLPPGGGPVIGVHIRRTDHVEAIRHASVERYEQMMDAEIRERPEVKFYLATDDGEVKGRLLHRFGEGRIITAQMALGRDSQAGMVGAVVDLIALSRTEKIIGSYYSSYSEIAAELGGIELIIP